MELNWNLVESNRIIIINVHNNYCHPGKNIVHSMSKQRYNTTLHI